MHVNASLVVHILLFGVLLPTEPPTSFSAFRSFWIFLQRGAVMYSILLYMHRKYVYSESNKRGKKKINLANEGKFWINN